jgi:inosine-uridine nucleoside N-ribohydrolase
MATPVILDVDTGIDDALAIALAVSDPGTELVAITTLAGNCSLKLATANTLKVLHFLGADEVPVHSGASKPLVREHRDAQYFHGIDGLGEADIPPFERPLGRDRGPAAAIRLAKERPGELTWVLLGPLTNLAIALNVAPELPKLLKKVVIMGGAFDVAGNTTAHGEFNMLADPEAANEVFRNRELDMTVVGLDVTHQTELTRKMWEAGATSDRRTAQLTAKLCSWVWTNHVKESTYLHDPLAFAVALDPSLIDVAQRSITVAVGEANRGETIAHRTGTIKVATSVDSARFLSWFCTTLGLPSS